MLLSALRVFQFRLPTRFLNTRHRPYRSLSTMGAIGTQTVDTTDRLAALRKHMAEHNVSAYIVPSEDQRKSLGPSNGDRHKSDFSPDFSEYPAECDNRRAFISGFNGSAGLLVAQS
jgi:Xaa-Pro aminopeptidase